MQALVEAEEAVWPLISEAFQGRDRRAWRAAVCYLGALQDNTLCKQVPWNKVLGSPMIWVPPGSFLMGSDKSKDPQAYHDESPQHPITLPGYWIGQCPVTVSHFRAFVDESGYQPLVLVTDVVEIRAKTLHLVGQKPRFAP